MLWWIGGGEIGTRISIGITCHNNGDNIVHLLNDLERQSLRAGNSVEEVTVVASGCKDNTVRTIGEFSRRDPRIRLIIENRRQGKPSAINKILENMSGDTLVLLAGDIRLPDSDFVDSLASHCTNGVGVAACRPVPVNDIQTKAGYIGHLLWNFHDRTLKAQVENGLWMQAGEAFAITRDAADYIPLDVINDDAYLVLRAQTKGHKSIYARDLTILNRTPEDLQDVLKQRARIICGHRQLDQAMGTSPNVLDRLIFRRPLVAARVVIKETKDQIKAGQLRIRWLLTLVVVEVAAHLLSRMYNFAPVWPSSESAKWPVPKGIES